MKTKFTKEEVLDCVYVDEYFWKEKFEEEEIEEVTIEDLVDYGMHPEEIIEIVNKYNHEKYLYLEACFCMKNHSIDSILKNVVENLFVNENSSDETEMKKEIFLEKLRNAETLFVYDLFVMIKEEEFYRILDETEEEVKKRSNSYFN